MSLSESISRAVLPSVAIRNWRLIGLLGVIVLAFASAAAATMALAMIAAAIVVLAVVLNALRLELGGIVIRDDGISLPNRALMSLIATGRRDYRAGTLTRVSIHRRFLSFECVTVQSDERQTTALFASRDKRREFVHAAIVINPTMGVTKDE